jgi:hypothetical protein
MKNKTFPTSMTLVIIANLATLLLAACTSGDDGIEDGVLSITFDGESCTYEGPTTLKAGPVTLLFHNESEGLADLALARITKGKTIQDMEDYVGEEPSTKPAPDWTQWITLEKVDPGESLTQEEVLDPGIYTMGCGRVEPYGGWFGTGLTVED